MVPQAALRDGAPCLQHRMTGSHGGKGPGKSSGFLRFRSGEGGGGLSGSEDGGGVALSGGRSDERAGRGGGEIKVERLVGVDLVAHP